VAGDGRSARLTALDAAPLPPGQYADGIAVGPDGTRLGVAIQRDGGTHGAVEVVSLATAPHGPGPPGAPGFPAAVSWADGRRFGFFWGGAGLLRRDR